MVPNWINIENGPILNPPSSHNSVMFGFSTPSPFSILLLPGEYLFECWGASGGNASILPNGNPTTVTQGFGGHGGYSRGKLTLHYTTKAFIYVGEEGYVVAGQNIDLPGTFGGGGGIYAPDEYGNGVKGGGSSDIRLFIDDLFHRIIVGGGGGGASGGQLGVQMPGGHGGGLVGGTGYSDYSASYYATSGSQAQDGSSTSYNGLPGDIGQFGQGGRTINTVGTNYGGGGGGGWFGGSGGGHRVAGGGGSSFVFNSSSIVNSSYAFDNSYYLADAEIISGEFVMPSPSLNPSLHNEINGQTGHGCVVITYLYYFSHAFNHESCVHLTFLDSSFLWSIISAVVGIY